MLQPGAKPRCESPAVQFPTHRRLQVFSLDPSADVQLGNSLISRSVLPVRWEDLAPGPVGEYLEVLDVDPSSDCVYDPVNLETPALLAQDGLGPSTGNPQFHQQMVYAVAMRTIANFEDVLGRRVLWAERQRDSEGEFLPTSRERYVQRLRIYPHALRERNAYYSPSKGALLFGYFNASTSDPRDELPGGIVFTCLSHDIVAHETTHAILDGMHRRMLDPSNLDMVAFHEAFADLVAIFQHFTMPGLLLDQIQKTRGDLRKDGLLARLAVQFARATGAGESLRNALDTLGADGTAVVPDPSALSRTTEPHERGAILVAAVFSAFIAMYENRVADLRRIATGGTGELPVGQIHPDLARRLAEEAVKLSQRVLRMCIRAVDYLPPVDVTFGDFLRALVTADADFVPDDPRRQRLAFIQAFRDRGIYPLDVRTLAEDALRWQQPAKADWSQIKRFLPSQIVLRTMAAAYDLDRINDLLYFDGKKERLAGGIHDAFQDNDLDAAEKRFLELMSQAQRDGPESPDQVPKPELGARFARYQMSRVFAMYLQRWIVSKAQSSSGEEGAIARQLGFDLELELEVHAVRPTVRLRPDGRSKLELVIVLTQRRVINLETGIEITGEVAPDLPTFVFRGGCTLIVDPENGRVIYAISKNVRGKDRLARQQAFLRGRLAELGTSAAVSRFGLTGAARDERRHFELFAAAHSSESNAASY